MKKILLFLTSIMLITDIKNWSIWSVEQKRNFVGFLIGVASIILAIIALPTAMGENKQDVKPYSFRYIETPLGGMCIGGQESLEAIFPKYSKALGYLIGYSDDFNNTQTFYKRQKEVNDRFLEAYPEIEKLADAGNEEAIYIKGWYRKIGLDGRERNASEALDIFKNSTTHCSKLAQSNLLEELKKPNEAYILKKELYLKRFPVAITNFAVFLRNNPKYNTDELDTVDMFRDAAEMGDKFAYRELGELALSQTPRNVVTAKDYFEKCSEKRISICSERLGDLYSYENNQKATKYYELAMKQGAATTTGAVRKYATSLMSAGTVEKNREGMAYLKLAAELGDGAAKYQYAVLLMTDNFVEFDKEEYIANNPSLARVYHSDFVIGRLLCESWVVFKNKKAKAILTKYIPSGDIKGYCQLNVPEYNTMMQSKYFSEISELTDTKGYFPKEVNELIFYDDLKLMFAIDNAKKRLGGYTR